MRILATGTPQSRLKSAINDAINPVIFLLVSVVFTAVFFTTRNGAPNDTSNGFSCRSDNPTFPWQGNWNRVWDSRLFLSITLAQGSFTFSQAKAIDICWDLVVGRGGQMYVAYAAYQVMRRSLLRSLESRSMHIPVTASLIFEGLSISTSVKISEGLVSTARKERKWNWRLVGFLCMIMYLLSFGTIVSAMTGYQAQMTPFYNDTISRNIFPSSNIRSSDAHDGAIVNDGQRIGFEPGATFSSNTNAGDIATLRNYKDTVNGIENRNYSNCGGEEGRTVSYTNFEMTIKYVDKLKSCNYSSSRIQFHNQTYDLEASPLDVRFEKVYNISGTLMNMTWLEQTSLCQPEKTYQWGFSWQLLFLFCMMTIVYACILTALQWDVWCFSQVNWFKQRHGLYRDILDMADELKHELREELKHSNGHYLTADTLEEVINTDRGTIYVSTESLPPPRRALASFRSLDNSLGYPMYQIDDRMTAKSGSLHE